MQRISTYSLHKIKDDVHFGFDPKDYSRFKFGDERVARLFGKDLARGFIKEYLRVSIIEKQIVVIASPYSFIPTATFSMKNYFVFELNRWLAENGFPVIQEAKVYRTVTYKEDYGELNAEERIRLISNDSFHIDSSFLENKCLLFLDDIKITGSHERMILKMVEEYHLSNDIHMLYFAELINKNIHPNIENYLNYFEIKSIFDLDEIIKSNSFCINTRIVKYILNTTPEMFTIFLANQTDDFIALLYDMALGNGYHTIEAYSANLQLVKQHLKVNNFNLA